MTTAPAPDLTGLTAAREAIAATLAGLILPDDLRPTVHAAPPAALYPPAYVIGAAEPWLTTDGATLGGLIARWDVHTLTGAGSGSALPDLERLVTAAVAGLADRWAIVTTGAPYVGTYGSAEYLTCTITVAEPI